MKKLMFAFGVVAVAGSLCAANNWQTYRDAQGRLQGTRK